LRGQQVSAKLKRKCLKTAQWYSSHLNGLLSEEVNFYLLTDSLQSKQAYQNLEGVDMPNVLCLDEFVNKYEA
jgi:hypothetical protein